MNNPQLTFISAYFRSRYLSNVGFPLCDVTFHITRIQLCVPRPVLAFGVHETMSATGVPRFDIPVTRNVVARVTYVFLHETRFFEIWKKDKMLCCEEELMEMMLSCYVPLSDNHPDWNRTETVLTPHENYAIVLCFNVR